METSTSVVALIPARGGSKSIPRKNIRHLAGRPLIYWSLDALTGCRDVNETWVSTDDAEIEAVVASYDSDVPLRVFQRDQTTATDTATSEEALLEFARQRTFDILVFVQATSPLIDSETISRAVAMVTSGKYDSVLSVVRQKRFIWMSGTNGAEAVNYNYRNRPRRQDFDGYLVENGACYVTRRSALLESGNRISGRIGFVEMDEAAYHEIDEPADWPVIEELLKCRKRESSRRLFSPQYVVIDCDGTLTDGGMYYTSDGEAMKKFNTRDAVGLRLLQQAGIPVAIMSGENSPIVTARASKIGITDVFIGIEDKTQELRRFANEKDVPLSSIAFIGDDINDLGVMGTVGFSACPSDAASEIRDIVDYVSPLPGGRGAVRNIVGYLLDRTEHTIPT